jgi:hypothetical protein
MCTKLKSSFFLFAIIFISCSEADKNTADVVVSGSGITTLNRVVKGDNIEIDFKNNVIIGDTLVFDFSSSELNLRSSGGEKCGLRLSVGACDEDDIANFNRCGEAHDEKILIDCYQGQIRIIMKNCVCSTRKSMTLTGLSCSFASCVVTSCMSGSWTEI